MEDSDQFEFGLPDQKSWKIYFFCSVTRRVWHGIWQRIQICLNCRRKLNYVVVKFFILVIMAAEPIKSFWWGRRNSGRTWRGTCYESAGGRLGDVERRFLIGKLLTIITTQQNNSGD